MTRDRTILGSYGSYEPTRDLSLSLLTLYVGYKSEKSPDGYPDHRRSGLSLVTPFERLELTVHSPTTLVSARRSESCFLGRLGVCGLLSPEDFLYPF